MAEPRVSALLPVHAGLDPAHLSRALESLAEQTRALDEVVVVEDGPLSDEHHDVLARASEQLGRVVHEVLPVNGGAGVSNGAGLLRCSGTWVFKVDGDDVNLPHRLERQLAHVEESGADVVGGAMWEFSGPETNVVYVRTPPLTHEEIARRMRWNNPMNHSTTLYRRELALRAGGYRDLRYMQDYDLFARMLAGGARYANLPEPLVLFRTGEAMFARRRSPIMRRCEWQLQRNLTEYGIVRRGRGYANFAARQGARSLPSWLMMTLHRRLFSSAMTPAHVD
jgi:glycosyltransferase involved in cell wall biosynthesis